MSRPRSAFRVIAGCWLSIAAAAAMAQTPQPTWQPHGPPPAATPQFAQASPAQPTISPAPPHDPQAMLRRLEETERELAALRAELGVPPASTSPVAQWAAPPAREASFLDQPPATPAAVSAPAPPKPATTYPNAKLTGFFQLDGGTFSQDEISKEIFGEIQNGVDFRRARLAGQGSVTEFTNYMLEMDFAGAGRPSFMDVWVEQTNLPLLGTVRIGQYRQPFSMDAMTSVRELDFLERALPFQAFVPFRRIGAMAYSNSEDERTTWAYSVFRTGGFTNLVLGDNRFGVDLGDGGGWSFSGRATHLLYYDEPAEGRYLLHVGAAYDYSNLTGNPYSSNSKTYEARVIPEFFMGDPAGGGLTANGTPFFASTGRLLANAFNLWGAEFAWQYGPVHFQSEYMAVVVDQYVGGNVFYDGAYGQVGWFLTGENRTYNRAWGVFDRVKPFSDFFGLGRGKCICGWGAWEATARLSYVNLNNNEANPFGMSAGPPPTPNPGRLTDLTLGVNWFWNSYTKLQFNWIHAFLDNRAFGDNDTDIFAARCQVGF